MTVSVSDNAVEVENGILTKAPVLSPSESDHEGAVMVFEDSDSEISLNGDDSDAWMDQVPSADEIQQHEEIDDASLGSALGELTLGETARRRDGVVSPNNTHSSYQTFNNVGGGGRSSSLGKVETPLESPSSSAFQKARRATAFAAIVPVGISGGERGPSLEAIAQQASQEVEEEEEDEDTGPSFREFALLSWSTNKLSLLSDETMFADDGPRALDAFLLDNVDFLDVYPQEASQESINPKALSRFCFPDGLRIRILPRVCMPGAMNKKWAGVGGDSCHILMVRRSDCCLICVHV